MKQFITMTREEIHEWMNQFDIATYKKLELAEINYICYEFGRVAIDAKADARRYATKEELVLSKIVRRIQRMYPDMGYNISLREAKANYKTEPMQELSDYEELKMGIDAAKEWRDELALFHDNLLSIKWDLIFEKKKELMELKEGLHHT